VHIEDPEGLDHAIAIHLLQKQAPLSNKELRFLRQQIGLSQADLGMPVGADAQTVAPGKRTRQALTRQPHAWLRPYSSSILAATRIYADM